MNTSFLFSTYSWYDEDLPLQYEFSFLDYSNNINMTLKSKSELSYSLSILPSGLEINNYNIICNVRVFDNYDSDSIINSKIIVNPLIINTFDLTNLILLQLNSSNGKSDITIK